MNINDCPNAYYVGNITEGTKEYRGSKYVKYPCKLQMEYSPSLPPGLRKKHLSIVYFICVNDQINKIGQTSGKGGIEACMNFYCVAGQDDCGPNRFLINALIREELRKGNKVSVYMLYKEPVLHLVEGLTQTYENYVLISPKYLEEACLKDYRKKEGALPEWNFQEAGLPTPAHINEQFASYRKKRAEART